jgi:diacylglycerol kinase
MKNSFIRALVHAWNGIKTFSHSCPKARIHYTLGLSAIILGMIAGIPMTSWAIIIICIAGVIAVEMLNEAVEQLCDHLHPEQHPAIGHIKDISAGAVLITAIGAAIIGSIMLLPPIWQLITGA